MPKKPENDLPQEPTRPTRRSAMKRIAAALSGVAA
jgi:hypothetical protein